MTGSVLIAGSTNFDRTLRVNALPLEGETLFAEGYAESLGGKGANQAIACALTGSRTVFATCIGAGPTAVELHRLLTAQPMTCLFEDSHAESPPGREPGQAWIHVDEHGLNFITVLAGANLFLSGAFIESALRNQTAPISHLVLQGESTIPMLEHAIVTARKHGVATVLNLAPPIALAPGLLRQLDTLIVNEHEAAQLAQPAGIDADDHPALHSWLGVERLIVTLGGSGAVLYTNGEPAVRVSACVVDVIDTAGAGDALVGVYAGCLADGLHPAAALEHAVAAASDSTRRSGASDSYAAKSFRLPA